MPRRLSMARKHARGRAWRYARRWLWVAIPLVVAWVGFTHRDALVQAAHLIGRAQLWWLGVGALAIGLLYVCRAAVYGIPLRLFGYEAPLPFLWGTGLTATAMHQLVPTGGASGYAFLTYAMYQRGVSAGEASLVAMVDTLSYAAAVASLVVASLVYLGLGGALYVRSLGLLFGVGLVIVGVAAWIFYLQRDQRRFVPLVLRLERRAAAWLHRDWPDAPVRRFLDEYYRGKRIIGRRRRAFYQMMALQYLGVACDAGALYAAFLALGVVPHPWTVLMGFVVAMSGVSFIGVPGGGGGFEALMSAFFSSRGVPEAQAIAATVLYRVVAFWLPVLVSLVVLFRLRKRQREVRREAPAMERPPTPARRARGRP
jgi:uncharacterized protein (TIRG00374 family)